MVNDEHHKNVPGIDLFIYSMNIESNSICGPQGVICQITLDASSFEKLSGKVCYVPEAA